VFLPPVVTPSLLFELDQLILFLPLCLHTFLNPLFTPPRNKQGFRRRQAAVPKWAILGETRQGEDIKYDMRDLKTK
jgi:hypothetical protein